MEIEQSNIKEYHAWECVSLLRLYSTLDFTISDTTHLMAFLHVLGRRFYKQKDNKFLSVFAKLKFKMKLSYECWF